MEIMAAKIEHTGASRSDLGDAPRCPSETRFMLAEIRCIMPGLCRIANLCHYGVEIKRVHHLSCRHCYCTALRADIYNLALV